MSEAMMQHIFYVLDSVYLSTALIYILANQS